MKYSTSVVNGASSPIISLAYALFNTIISGSDGCLVEISMPARTFRLWSDASQSWLGPLRPIAGHAQQQSLHVDGLRFTSRPARHQGNCGRA